MPLPRNSNIVVGVSGGIAAYKACELVRLLQKAGNTVRVVMSANAQNFVGALTFEALTNARVVRDLSETQSGEAVHSHIELAQWGDAFVIAPATANCLAKLAGGIADDALSTEALAFTGQVFVAPAMNTRMWQADVTRENVEKLRLKGVQILGPETGELSCGETGEGKMLEPAEICRHVCGWLPAGFTGKIVITSGPTRTYLDPVRFITNKSSGRMGHALSAAALAAGADVTLITGPVEAQFKTLPAAKVVPVETTEQMYEALQAEAGDAAIVIAAAAVSDFHFDMHAEKLNREVETQITLTAARDVIASLPKDEQRVYVGFAAQHGANETEQAKVRAKLTTKGLDFIVYNDVSRADIGFDSDDNEVLIVEPDKQQALPQAAKSDIARQIIKKAIALYEVKNDCHQ